MARGRGRFRSALLGAAAAMLSAAALWHGTGLAPVWWLAWLGPWPAVAFALRAAAPTAAAVAVLAWAGGGLNLWHYLRTTLGVPLPVVLVAIAVPAVVFTAAVLLTRALARQGRLLLAALALPAAWTTYEHLTARLSPHGTFGSLAYSQAEFLPVWQVAALGGATAVSFLLLLLPSAAAVATLPARRGLRIRLLLVSAGALALGLGYGGWRLRAIDPAAPSLAVALAAADLPEQPVAVGSEPGRELLARYAAAVASATGAGADVVVLPETTLRVADGEADAVARALAGAAGGRGTVVVGLDRRTGEVEENVAVALGSDGSAAASYAKQHLLLPPESRYRAGSGLTVVRPSSVPAGLAVCKDLDFPPLARAYAAAGARFLLVPAWDFRVDGWLHARMAVLRGVEGGFSVARAARDGRLTLSDDRGRVLAEARSDARPLASLADRLPVGAGRTLYARLGDWFGWSACALLAIAVFVATRRR